MVQKEGSHFGCGVSASVGRLGVGGLVEGVVRALGLGLVEGVVVDGRVGVRLEGLGTEKDETKEKMG